MAETMKAAVVHEYGKPLVIEEVPVPEVRPGRILVKVEACGVCHTDLHAAEGPDPAPDAEARDMVKENPERRHPPQ